MIEIIDQTGVNLMLNQPAHKIVSLVPSVTELLFHLQLEEEVKGITLFCSHPLHWKNHKVRIGGTKKIKHDLIDSLQPDLILANKEENTREDVLKLREKYSVYTSDIKHLNDALIMIEQTGILTGRVKQSRELNFYIRKKFEKINEIIAGKPLMRALYLIWKNPFMTIGCDTFIHHMMKRAGFKNIFSHLTRYPEISEQQIKESGAEVVLLSSEPFPFKQKHVNEIKKINPLAKVLLVDGTFFSWYGSRLKEAPDYLSGLRSSMDTIRNFDAQS